jgi:hypothetical protein
MLRIIAVAATSIPTAAWQHHRTPSRRLTRRRADLYGGQDTQRNEDIEALKRAFYGGGTEDSFRDAAASDARLVATANEFGLIKDVPLCRWSMHLLPHQQTILNVWQPQYTHMQGLRVRNRGDGVQLIRHRRDVFTQVRRTRTRPGAVALRPRAAPRRARQHRQS